MRGVSKRKRQSNQASQKAVLARESRKKQKMVELVHEAIMFIPDEDDETCSVAIDSIDDEDNDSSDDEDEIDIIEDEIFERFVEDLHPLTEYEKKKSRKAKKDEKQRQNDYGGNKECRKKNFFMPRSQKVLNARELDSITRAITIFDAAQTRRDEEEAQNAKLQQAQKIEEMIKKLSKQINIKETSMIGSCNTPGVKNNKLQSNIISEFDKLRLKAVLLMMNTIYVDNREKKLS